MKKTKYRMRAGKARLHGGQDGGARAEALAKKLDCEELVAGNVAREPQLPAMIPETVVVLQGFLSSHGFTDHLPKHTRESSNGRARE
jgi:hypothetical protein